LVIKNIDPAGCQWLTSIILAVQEAEIRRMTDRGQTGTELGDHISKTTNIKRTGGMAQVVIAPA
jgi:hypothetical protein